MCYLISFLLIIFVFNNNIGFNLSTLFSLMFIFSLVYQLQIFKKNNSMSCLKAFKVNNYSGAFMFMSILLS